LVSAPTGVVLAAAADQASVLAGVGWLRFRLRQEARCTQQA